MPELTGSPQTARTVTVEAARFAIGPRPIAGLRATRARRQAVASDSASARGVGARGARRIGPIMVRRGRGTQSGAPFPGNCGRAALAACRWDAVRVAAAAPQYNLSITLWGVRIVKQQRLKKLGGSVAAVIPRAMLERLRLEAGDDVFVVETPDGILITPYDPDFRDAMAAYERGARKFRNALRELAQ